MPLMQKDDPELLQRAQQGDDTALATLIAHMMPVIRKGAAANLAPGLDFDDAVQEGLIGLFGAVRSFHSEEGRPFAPYAAACIVHAQRDARRAALRKKHAPLNFSVPLPDAETAALPGPEEQAIASEHYAATLARLATDLSELERRALLANLHGQTTAQAARTLGCTPKAAANALARARRKLRGEIS